MRLKLSKNSDALSEEKNETLDKHLEPHESHPKLLCPSYASGRGHTWVYKKVAST